MSDGPTKRDGRRPPDPLGDGEADDGSATGETTGDRPDTAGGARRQSVAERLDAVERRLAAAAEPDDSDRETPPSERLADLEAAVADLRERVDELEAGLAAVRGYVGGARAVDREVERRADLALARTERLERHVDVPDANSPNPAPDAVAAAVPDTDIDASGTGESAADVESDGDGVSGGDGEATEDAVLDRLRDVL